MPFCYGYHKDAHTSLVGVRELAYDHRCFWSDKDVDRWIDETVGAPEEEAGGISKAEKTNVGEREGVSLLAWPGQSNMTGRRLPLRWFVMRLCGCKGCR